MVGHLPEDCHYLSCSKQQQLHFSDKKKVIRHYFSTHATSETITQMPQKLDCSRQSHVLPKRKSNNINIYLPSEHLHGLNRFLGRLQIFRKY
jgi:hypothetical protein